MDDQPEKKTNEPKTLRVACANPGGLILRVYEESRDPDSGALKMVPVGEAVRLNGPDVRMSGVGNTAPTDLEPGITDVNEEFIRLYLKQNRANPMVTMRQIYLLDEEAEQDPAEER